jgi:hypothetical protein
MSGFDCIVVTAVQKTFPGDGKFLDQFVTVLGLAPVRRGRTITSSPAAIYSQALVAERPMCAPAWIPGSSACSRSLYPIVTPLQSIMSREVAWLSHGSKSSFVRYETVKAIARAPKTSWPRSNDPWRSSRMTCGRSKKGRPAPLCVSSPGIPFDASSAFRGQADIVHEQCVDAGFAERDDRVGRRADDRLTVVERRIDDDRHAGLLVEAGDQLVEARI